MENQTPTQPNPIDQSVQPAQPVQAPASATPIMPPTSAEPTATIPTIPPENIAPATYGKKSNSASNASVIILVVILVLAVIAAGAYFFFGQQIMDQLSPTEPTSQEEVFVDPLLDMPAASPESELLDDDPVVYEDEVPATEEEDPAATTDPTTVTNLETSELALPKYTNPEYGFEVSYPESYQLMTDNENLYGYPNGVALLYQGGQAYDLVIEAWDTEAAYQSAYGTRVSDLKVIENKGKYITILNNTQEPENAAIVASFKVVN